MLRNEIKIFLNGKIKYITWMILVIWLCHNACPVFCEEGLPVSGIKNVEADETLSEILDNIEKKYHNAGFKTDFIQSSILQALNITDKASGQAIFKYPGMMKWEYEKPEKQSIITDGKNLWIYRPDDNQVIVAEFPSLFGEGRRAGFLSDIGVLRKKFLISEEEGDKVSYKLKLIPGNKNPELSMIILHVYKKDFSVTEVVTYNEYGDETRIELKNIDFTANPDDSVFLFKIPENTDIIQLD
ncbi:MAG: outer membrane lipoprotein carrier protein LolA [Deltaproteobacteria bacterium]|nr:outer membrane lipoprotein carrier protein LolA [Deltaproteobacteria bacterium]